MNEAKLAAVIEGIVGTRTYLPVDENEAILIFERKRYIHIFKGLESIFGSTAPIRVADKLISIMGNDERKYHNELLEKLSCYPSELEAAHARYAYIKTHNLPLKLNIG